MKPLYIFDLDGTIALNDHRQHILTDESLSTDERWRRFFAACVDDEPNRPVILTLKLFRKAVWGEHDQYSVDIWIWSARSDEVKPETQEWIHEYVGFDIPLWMRPGADKFTKDADLKERWLNELSATDRKRLVCSFDDRQSVVDMWRRNGVTCLQVAPGNF